MTSQGLQPSADEQSFARGGLRQAGFQFVNSGRRRFEIGIQGPAAEPVEVAQTIAAMGRVRCVVGVALTRRQQHLLVHGGQPRIPVVAAGQEVLQGGVAYPEQRLPSQ